VKIHYLRNNPGRTAIVDDKEYLFFSGYSYLGVEWNKRFRNYYMKGMKNLGMLFPSSRISNTRIGLYEQMERRLASKNMTEDAVLYSSGYLAGKAISSLLLDTKGKPKMFVAPSTHPAINCNLELPDKSFDQWSKALVEKLNNSSTRECIILGDSVNIMKGRINDFSFLSSIRPDIQVTCLIDNSHGAGIIGEDPFGFNVLLPQQLNIDCIYSYSLSKAYHIEGGIVCCSSKIAEELRARADYSGSTPINPSMVFAFMQGFHLYESQRKKLQENIAMLKELTNKMKFISNHDDLPIFILKKKDIAAKLFEQSIIISSFNYPLGTSRLVNRVVVNALHEESDLKYLVKCLGEI